MSRVWVFDLMDTLVRDPFYVQMPIFHGISHQELLASSSLEAWIDFECGRISEEEYSARAFLDGRRYDYVALRNCLYESYEWLPGMEELVHSLSSSGERICVLSNYPSWFELIEAKLGVRRYFSGVFVSYQLGVRKPDAAAYHRVLHALGAAAEHCIFVDDRLSNCEAAASIGMATHHFLDAPGLRALMEGREDSPHPRTRVRP